MNLPGYDSWKLQEPDRLDLINDEEIAMTEKEWTKFFELLEKVVELPNMSVGEKIAEVKAQAETYGEAAEMCLEEFTAWNFGY